MTCTDVQISISQSRPQVVFHTEHDGRRFKVSERAMHATDATSQSATYIRQQSHHVPLLFHVDEYGVITISCGLHITCYTA